MHKLLKGGSSFSVKSQMTGQQDTLKSQNNKVMPNNRFSTKSIFLNARLKIRVSRFLTALSARRFTHLTPQLFQKINDKSCFLSSTNKAKEYNKIQVEDEHQSSLLHNSTLPNRSNSRFSKKKNTCQILIQQLKFILKSIPIVNPNSLPKLVWDSLLSFVIVLMLTVVPVKMAVQDHFLSYYLGTELVLIMIIILTIIDILINLNTAFFKNGKIVVDRVQIVLNYFSQVGVCDFLIMQALLYELAQNYYNESQNNLSLDLKENWFYQSQQILLLCLFYLKSQKLNKFFYKVEEMLSFKRRTTNFLSLVKLLFFILKVGHIFACLWLFVGRQNRDNSWLKNLSDNWKDQYIKSFYFIAVTMTTIGYGDIVPTNITETIISIFSMIIAAGVFGYTINSIGTIFLQLKKEDEQIQENLFTINRYMSEKNISRELQQSIREYLEYHWSQWKDDNSEEEQKILQQLSEEMRMSLLLQANKMILNDCQFLQKNFSQEALQNCVNIIKEKKLTPNEFLINSIDDNSKNGILFFVERGEIDIYQEFSLSHIQQVGQTDQPLQNIPYFLTMSQNLQSQTQNLLLKGSNEQNNLMINERQYTENSKPKMQIQTIKKGQYFGENSFFTNMSNKFIARSRGFSKVLYIERDHFIEFLKANHFNEDYERFCHLKDSILQNDLTYLHQKCFICKNLEHNPLQCSYVHHQPLKMFILKKFNFSKDIRNREKKRRRKVPQKNCLTYLDDIYEQFEKFIQKNESYIEENIQLVDYTMSDISDDFDDSESSSSDSNSSSTVQEEQNNDSNKLKQPQNIQIENCKDDEIQKHSNDISGIDSINQCQSSTTETKKLKQQENKTKCNQVLPTKNKQMRRKSFSKAKTTIKFQSVKEQESQSDSSESSDINSQNQIDKKSHQSLGSQKKIEHIYIINGISKKETGDSNDHPQNSIISKKQKQQENKIRFNEVQPTKYRQNEPTSFQKSKTTIRFQNMKEQDSSSDSSKSSDVNSQNQIQKKTHQSLGSQKKIDQTENSKGIKEDDNGKKQKLQENKIKFNQVFPTKQKQIQPTNFQKSKTTIKFLNTKQESSHSDSSESFDSKNQSQVEEQSHQSLESQKKIDQYNNNNWAAKKLNQNSERDIIPSISSFKRIQTQEDSLKGFVRQMTQRNIERQPNKRQSMNPFQRLKTIKAGLIQRNTIRQSNFIEGFHFQNQDQHESYNEQKQSSNQLEKKEKEENSSVKKQKKLQLQHQQDYSNDNFFQSDFAFISQFEKMKNYKHYFPRFNSEKILNKLRKKRIQGNNILKLTLQAKSKVNQARRESIFQVFQQQLNFVKTQRLSDKFKQESLFSQQSNENSNNNQSTQQNEQKIKVTQIQEDNKEISNVDNNNNKGNSNKNSNLADKRIFNQSESFKVETMPNQSNKNLIKNFKLDLFKKPLSPLSPQQKMFLSINSKKNSSSEEINYDLEDEDFNLDKSLTGSGYNRLKLSMTPSNFTRYNSIKNDTQQGEDNQSEIYQSNI